MKGATSRKIIMNFTLEYAYDPEGIVEGLLEQMKQELLPSLKDHIGDDLVEYNAVEIQFSWREIPAARAEDVY